MIKGLMINDSLFGAIKIWRVTGLDKLIMTGG